MRIEQVIWSVIGFAAALLFAVVLTGCKVQQNQTKEVVNYRDSVIYHYKDSIIWHYRDSVVTIYNRVTIKDSTGLVIQFGHGGGTYNAKTGEATNVAGVQQTDIHHEQRDSTAHYRSLSADYKHTADSLTNQLTTLQTDYEQIFKKGRSGYDKFCSWWFWITALLLLIKIAAWVMEKIPATAPYIIIARRFVPFL